MKGHVLVRKIKIVSQAIYDSQFWDYFFPDYSLYVWNVGKIEIGREADDFERNLYTALVWAKIHTPLIDESEDFKGFM